MILAFLTPSFHARLRPVFFAGWRCEGMAASRPWRVVKWGWFLASAVVSGYGAAVPAEPKLFRSPLRIEPARAQIATMPEVAAEWWLSASVVARLDEVLAEGKFPAAIGPVLRERLTRIPATGDGVIVPDAALLDLFSPMERLRWWAVLAEHPAGSSYRWPVAVQIPELAAMARESGFEEGVRRIRKWGTTEGSKVYFADLFALNNAFQDEEVRRRFFQRLLGTETNLVKLVADATDPAVVSARAAYWQSNGRSRALEPILMAVGRIEGHDRIDLAHLLPRLARAVLYTYPPDFAEAAEPAVENAIAAAGFFDPAFDPRPLLATGFSAWLRDRYDEVTDSVRHYGDIVVFEDPAENPWPFALVYLADGMLFGRGPTQLSPWELLPEAGIARLNPRLGGSRVKIFRAKGAVCLPAFPDWTPHPWTRSAELTDLRQGPWGQLKAYDVLLAPSSELLEQIVVPEKAPVWKFARTTPAEIDQVLREVDLPSGVRGELQALFADVVQDADGSLTVHPSQALVLSTPAAFRERLFSRLVYGETAFAYAQEVLIPAQLDAARWFPEELLPAHTREVLLSLVYRKGNGLALSDFGALYHALPDTKERTAALRALYRTPALIVLLERPKPEDAGALADYWRLDPQKSLSRLLQSFAASEDFRYLDIIQLLPPLARELMNVYTAAWGDVPAPSCYWSALNFDAERPDSRLLVTAMAGTQTEKIAEEKLRDGYEPAAAAERLGDIIVYRRKSDGFPVHMCAFVAADVVYTKNGLGLSSPWCLLRLEDMDALYLREGVVERFVYRARPAPRG
jgi:hypothetical protein